MSSKDEAFRILRNNSLYQSALRFIRRAPDTFDKSRAFRRDVLNAIKADQFEQHEFHGVKRFYDRDSLLAYCLSQVGPNHELAVELGVGSATSSQLILKEMRRLGLPGVLHGFDSFMGLPEAWGEIARPGTYSYDKPLWQDERFVVHAGWFAETLPAFVAEVEGAATIGFIHVDCDLYSSTKEGLIELGPLLRSGSILLFDEYWNYLEAEEHEQLALREFCNEQGWEFNYIGYNVDYMQAAVVITKPSTSRRVQ